MAGNRILIFSSSRVGSGDYLQSVVPIVNEFLGDRPLTIAFIPFAAVDNDFAAYALMVRKGFTDVPYNIETVEPGNAKQVLERAGAIMVGGGNTFKLLHDIYELKLLDVMRDKINTGAAYIGWSAGANIVGPSIGTTNDMPIIEPKSFNALGLLPFQINPHYNNEKPAGHNGETRDQRLQEFIQLNPQVPIVALPEGAALKLDNGILELAGNCAALLFSGKGDSSQIEKKEIQPKEDLSYLL
ncbi:MAG: dipeptidase PepE [Gloeobacteraceae cyanobacterium ES-bin-316]|nr:dipeptidase PepE [Ferruginibacter sp.]